LQTFWYYIDPFFSNSQIREDTDGDRQLNLVNDHIVTFYFDSKTMARRFDDTDGDSIPDNEILPPVEFEQIKNLWEAGRILWNTSASARTILTPDPSDSSPPISLLAFSSANSATLRDYLQAGSDDEAEAIIRYVRGEDDPVVSGTTYDYRTRTAALDLNDDGDVADTVTINGTAMSESAKVWKLGDIVNSTPKILSWTYLNNYDQVYGDSTYEDFLNTSGYKARGMVFVGANDGMLHAFKLGTLEIFCRDCPLQAELTGTDLGKEMWAFIPKNVLPYLKYNADPNYCHIYNVDLSPYIFDASINGSPDAVKDVNSWRTILIGGMRLGGACKGAATTNGVQVPAAGKGYSSYFAIDVTDQNNPTLLWEFSDPDLGFATTGPSIIRVGDTDMSKNGRWFVVFGSGPTGPIDTTSHQFRGYSDQNLKLFIIDLKNGPIAGNLWTLDTGIPDAFAGSLINSTNDPDLNYNDDAVYVPYVKRSGSGVWEDGGIGRLFTKESQNPSTWVWRTVIDGAGPVTSSVQRLQHKNKGQLWIYFGAGRYFSTLDTGAGDLTKRWKIYGFKDPCFSSAGYDTDCTAQITLAALDNVTDITQVKSDPDDVLNGWYISLDNAGTGYGAERVITDPLATTLGIVFFTTYKPYSDICAYGGRTVLWAVKYATGGAPSTKGIALIQVSTGAIEQINLSTALTEHGGRSSTEIEGVPPTAQGLSILIPPPPIKRSVHIKER
ncbi:MAG: PilC/PilY family type IV pilus protein, partial [Nitrospirota bacterium]